MTCPTPLTFGPAQALNIAANDFTLANQNSGGITLSVGPTEFLVITKPRVVDSGGVLTYDAWSAWPSDDSTSPLPPVVGQTWNNRFHVYGSNGGGETLVYNGTGANGLDPDQYLTEDDAYRALDALLPMTFTGYSQYRITCERDPNLGDNRGGLSLLARVGNLALPGDSAPDITGSEVPTITIACFAKLEFSSGDVRLCDGGMLQYDGEVYESEHSVFGSLHSVGGIGVGFGDLSEALEMALTPNGDAVISDWWRDDLFDARVRIWMGFVDSDLFNVTNANLVADMLVDTYEIRRGPSGEDVLALDLISRSEKLFLRNEGNVCSQRFHQSIWPGENGMNNFTDLTDYLAWGARTPNR